MRNTIRLYKVQPSDEGTIVVFSGEVYGGGRDGAPARVAVDHRMAPPIIEALQQADDATDRVLIEAEDWQLV